MVQSRKIFPVPGFRPFFRPELVMQVKALACEPPHQHGLPLSRYSGRDLVREVARRGLAAGISGRTIWRWLDEEAIGPWQQAALSGCMTVKYVTVFTSQST
jgi:hypothetical protein